MAHYNVKITRTLWLITSGINHAGSFFSVAYFLNLLESRCFNRTKTDQLSSFLIRLLFIWLSVELCDFLDVIQTNIGIHTDAAGMRCVGHDHCTRVMVTYHTTSNLLQKNLVRGKYSNFIFISSLLMEAITRMSWPLVSPLLCTDLTIDLL